jgi:hypothetical protein
MSRVCVLIILALVGCGFRAEFSKPGVYECNDGRRIHTSEWTPYVGDPAWLENKRTGERLVLKPPLHCWIVSDT